MIRLSFTVPHQDRATEPLEHAAELEAMRKTLPAEWWPAVPSSYPRAHRLAYALPRANDMHRSGV